MTPGDTLFIVLDTFSNPGSGRGTVRATQFNGAVDQYVPGEFVFLNTGILGAATLQDLDAFTWSHRFDNNEDLAVYAEFAGAVPEPTATLLFGVGGVLVGMAVRRRAAR